MTRLEKSVSAGRPPGATALLGALELKRCYFRNLMTAMFIVMGIALLLCLVGLLIQGDVKPINEREWARNFGDYISDQISTPPSVEVPRDIKPALPMPISDHSVLAGPIEVVTDTEFVAIEPVFASQDELNRQNGLGAAGGSIGGVNTGDVGLVYVPPPDTFIPFEQRPQLLDRAPIKYPSVAKRAGIEGDVYVRVYIDFDGSVIKAEIAQESGANAGFEEAALESARKSRWTPAMQNHQPVRVWTAYEIKFRLR